MTQDKKDVLQEAQDAFWAVIAKRHPEIKTGDLTPMDAFAFDTACESVVNSWVYTNTPYKSRE